jgi:hypothetical protein
MVFFRPEGEPDPISIHDFEEIFLAAGGVRCWSGERITSPLVLADVFPYYRKWCKVKADIDPEYVSCNVIFGFSGSLAFILNQIV